MKAEPLDYATYTQREDCDEISVRVDYYHGDRTSYYDADWALVAVVADNSFGYAACGPIPSCTGNVVLECRLCRGSGFTDDNVPDCPPTIWD